MKNYALLLFYVAASLLIGKEFHPFSRFPMYNSFPNWSYVFYLKNERGEMVCYRRDLADGDKKNAGGVAHMFYSLFDYKGYKYGDGKEDTAQLHSAGKELMATILKGEDTNRFKFDTLKLYKRYYHLEKEQIVYRDDLMYEQAVKP